ncbi:hypothetical protein J2TS4_33980 [Paenibacillus sp. J2TS4]|nr:hypothetical protein J2TS4_33980 [Paenibacillus sp. J2TS4]
MANLSKDRDAKLQGLPVRMAASYRMQGLFSYPNFYAPYIDKAKSIMANLSKDRDAKL